MITTMRWYLSNMSYPELREVRGFWTRQRLWWRALGQAATTPAFWRFVGASLTITAIACTVCLLIPPLLTLEPTAAVLVRSGAILAAIVGAGGLSLTIGGDAMRPAMRAVSETARLACPACGHQLRSQLGATDDHAVRCPECGASAPRSMFAPPYAIPDEFLTWPNCFRGRTESRS
jgi:predicted RNA-binding Zn-ribbon protein involved in translation (DUF1610 family)